MACLIIAINLLLLFSPVIFATTLTNSKVHRSISFTGELVKVTCVITIKNHHKIPAKHYDFCVDPDVSDYHIEFHDSLDNTRQLSANRNTQINQYLVTFPEPVIVNGSYTFSAEIIIANKIHSWFSARRDSEINTLQYLGNVHYYSKYKTKSSETKYSLDVENQGFVEASLDPNKKGNSSLSYSFKNVDSFAQSTLRLDFSSAETYYRVLNLERIVDVSLYGRIEVMDSIVLKNNAPKLVGPYEPSFYIESKPFHSRIPKHADYLRYYDEIGLITKYIQSYKDTHQLFSFKPRFPLVGGWKTTYNVKYLVPTFDFLKYNQKTDEFLLEMPALDHILNNVIVEQVNVRVLLPEGGEITKIKSPEGFKIRDSGGKVTCTSLTLAGRKTVEFSGKNLLEKHSKVLEIHYEMSPLQFYRAPLLISAELFLVFLVVIVVNRYSVKF